MRRRELSLHGTLAMEVLRPPLRVWQPCLMSLAPCLGYGLLMVAQSVQISPAAPSAKQAGDPIAVSVGVTVRVLRPAVIDLARDVEREGIDREEGGPFRQLRVDAAGTVWIEFS